MTASAPRTAERQSTPQSRAAQLMRSLALGAVRGLAWLGRPVSQLTARVGTPLRSAFGLSQLPGAVVAPAGAGSVGSACSEPAAARQDCSRLLRQTIETALIPALVARYSHVPQARPAFDQQASQLAQLVLLDRSQAATDLIREVHVVADSLVHVLSSLIEPAACRLGDLWGNDDCTEFDVALGLHHLLAAVRRLGIDQTAPSVPVPCVALLAPQPGEGHVLSTALHADLAWQAGWEPQVEFPGTDEALQELLATRRVDLLDLSLSAAFRREHRVERMATTVARARRASLNPSLVVVVSGRLFQEGGDAARLAGADACSSSAWHFKQLLAQTAWMREAARAGPGWYWPTRSRT